jgi:hypothetical protein
VIERAQMNISTQWQTRPRAAPHRAAEAARPRRAARCPRRKTAGTGREAPRATVLHRGATFPLRLVRGATHEVQ